MRYFYSILFLSASIFFGSVSLEAKAAGKVDVAPGFFRLKLKKSKKTIKTTDFGGGRIDSTIRPWEKSGVCVRPFFQGGAANHSYFWTGGLGIGHYTPITEKFCLVPTVGYTHGRFKTHIHQKIPILPVTAVFKNVFRSNSAYVGVDLFYKFTSNVYGSLIVQYAWAHTDSKLEQAKLEQTPSLGLDQKSKGWSGGPNLAATVDYYFSDSFAVNVAVGYNHSMDKKKQGLIGMGGKLGLTYYF